VPKLNSSQLISLIYHDLFDYPLTKSELIKWQTGNNLKLNKSYPHPKLKNNYYYLNNSKLVIYRQSRQKYSDTKFLLARMAANQIANIPTIKFIGITGSLAMNNANKNSDIDIIIITQKNTLWITRLLTYLYARLKKLNLRKPNNKSQKDKLCLNIWLDESDLVIKKQNIYTAHELAQIVPLLNRGETYQKLLYQNKWLLDYWPNAVKISTLPPPFHTPVIAIPPMREKQSVLTLLNLLAFRLQLLYMKDKITNEKINLTQAFFHPRDYSKLIINKLKSKNVFIS